MSNQAIHRKRLIPAFFAGAVLVGATMFGTIAFAHNETRPGCAKVAESGDGPITINGITVTFTETPAGSGTVIWNVEPGISGTVELYGGSNGATFDYSAGTGVTPLNNGGQIPALSHIHYCLTYTTPSPSASPTPSDTPTATPTPSETPTPDVQGSPSPLPSDTPTVTPTPTPDPVGRIRLLKYEDLNGNGTRDSGEPVMPGVEFSVSGPTGDSTFVTNSSGLKHMIGIPFGTYTFTEDVPDGYTLTSHPNPFSVVVNKTSITYVFVGNQPDPTPTPTPDPTVDPQGSPSPLPSDDPTPTPDPTLDPQGSPDPTVDPQASSDPSDDPGVTTVGDSSDPTGSAKGDSLVPLSFADTGLGSLAGLGTTLVSIGSYAAVRRRLRS